MRKHFYIDDIRVEVTYHALKRYAERVRSLTDPTEAELQRCVGEIEQLLTLEKRGSSEAPYWCGEVYDDIDAAKRSDWYMLVGDDIAFPCRTRTQVHVFITTTLTRGGMSDKGRAKRNARKQRRRMLARERRSFQSWLGENNRWN